MNISTSPPFIRWAKAPFSGDSPPSQSLITVATVLGAIGALLFFGGGRSKKGVYVVGGVPIFNVWSFFTRRYDFLRYHFKKTGEKLVQFHILQHRVIAMSGHEARKLFFTDTNLNLNEGYKILMGGAPMLSDINVTTDLDTSSDIVKKILSLTRKERVAELFPDLLDDLDRRMNDWGNQGTMNPFKDVYDLVFQMTVRLATCREFAEDKDAILKLAQYYWDVEKSATPVSLLLPWFPGPARRQNKKATTGMYNLIQSFVDLRRRSTPSLDTIDILIAEGESNNSIIGLIFTIVFAGVINTGVNSCWALLHLGANPEWKEKVRTELKALVDNHTDTSSTEAFHKRLASVPLNAWEEELPSLDLVIRETIRISSGGGTLLRRNLMKDIPVDETVVHKGDFLAYSFTDVHLNSDIYPNPQTFDPARYTEGREEDKKVHFGYLGWGAGRHPCAGTRIAKLEIKVVLAMLILRYDYELVDGSGKYPKSLPQPDRNDIMQARPIGDPCYLKFKRVME